MRLLALWRATFINMYSEIQCLYIRADTEQEAIALCNSTPLAANPEWRCIKGEPIVFAQLPDHLKKYYRKQGITNL